MHVYIQLKAVNVLLLALIVVWIVKKREFFAWLKRFYLDNMVIFNAMILSLGVIVGAGREFIRCGAGVEIFAIILLLRLLNSCTTGNLYRLKVPVILITVILYSYTVWLSVPNYRFNKNMIDQIERHESEVVVMHEYQVPSAMRSYVLSPLPGVNQIGFYGWFRYTQSKFLAATYGYDRLALVPDVVYDAIVSRDDKINDIKRQKEFPFYVIPVDEDAKDKIPVFVFERPYNVIPPYFRPFHSKESLARYEVGEMEGTNYEFVDIGDEHYLFVGRNGGNEDNVAAIELRQPVL